MSRYIDADKINYPPAYRHLLQPIIMIQQTADVVEVGKCKDCVHHGSFLPWCKIFDKRMNDDDYCSRFERK